VPGAVVSDADQVADDDGVVGEARWPMAGAVVAAMVLTILLPEAVRPGPWWLLPLIEGVLLVIVIAGDPGRINSRSASLVGFDRARVRPRVRVDVGNGALDRRPHPWRPWKRTRRVISSKPDRS
jgi:hypothetical protein